MWPHQLGGCLTRVTCERPSAPNPGQGWPRHSGFWLWCWCLSGCQLLPRGPEQKSALEDGAPPCLPCPPAPPPSWVWHPETWENGVEGVSTPLPAGWEAEWGSRGGGGHILSTLNSAGVLQEPTLLGASSAPDTCSPWSRLVVQCSISVRNGAL